MTTEQLTEQLQAQQENLRSLTDHLVTTAYRDMMLAIVGGVAVLIVVAILAWLLVRMDRRLSRIEKARVVIKRPNGDLLMDLPFEILANGYDRFAVPDHVLQEDLTGKL